MFNADTHARLARPSLVGLVAAMMLVACVADPSAPHEADVKPAFAKALASGPAVTSTLPTSGDQAQTLDVHVYGSGFGPDAAAEWALRGVADPTKVRTNKTTFVSSTEVVANVTIAANATIAYWDVRVKTGGKTGVGTELFEVTTAIPILSAGGNALAVNDRGDIVGQFSPAANTVHAFVVSGTDGALSDLGWQSGIGISADGLIVVGGIGTAGGNPIAGVWTRPAGATWPSEGSRLPDPLGITTQGGRGNGVAAIASEGVIVITGNLNGPYGIASYWQSTDGTWSAPAQRLPLPPPFANAGASVIAATTGDIVGELRDASGNLLPAIWRRISGGYAVAAALPLPNGYPIGAVHGISPDGTIIAGNVRVSTKGKQVIAPVAWTRNPTTGSYTVNLLPTLTGTYGTDGRAYGVTVVGTQVRAVGTSFSSSNSTFLHGVLWTWTVGASDFQVRDIGGLGTKTDVVPYAINPSGTIAVGGNAKWRLP